MLSVIIPAYNEEELLARTVEEITRAAKETPLALEIIIVNDGSTDQTLVKIKELEKMYPFVHSICQEINQGMGAGVRRALEQVKGSKFLIVPGDNDLPANILKILFAHYNEADLVMTFYLNKEVRGKAANVFSSLYGIIYMSFFGIYLQYINSPTVYPVEKVRELKLEARRFSIVAEMTVKLLRRGASYLELPGYRELKVRNRNSFTLKNWAEVIRTFILLVYEIHGRRRHFYNLRPVRVYKSV